MNSHILKNSLLGFAIATSSLAITSLSDASGVEVRLAYFSVLTLALMSFLTLDLRKLTLRPTISAFFSHFYIIYLPFFSLLSFFVLSQSELGFSNALKSYLSVYLFVFAVIGITQHYTSHMLFRTYITVIKIACVCTIVEQFLWVFFKIEASEFLRSSFIGFNFRGEDGLFMRVHAWYREPAHFAQVISLAIIMIFSRHGKPFDPVFPEAKSKFWCAVLVLASVMTFSLSGLIPFICGGIIMTRRLKYWPLALGVLLVLSMATQMSASISDRITAIFSTHYTENLSVYAYLSNVYAAKQSLIEFPFGRGLGNHVLAHRDWLLTHPWITKLDFHSLNSLDGGSLITRMISELGVGAFIMIFIWFLQTFKAFSRCYEVDINYDLRISALFAIYCFAMRQGSYTLFEFWFFVAVFIAANRALTNGISSPYKVSEVSFA